MNYPTYYGPEEQEEDDILSRGPPVIVSRYTERRQNKSICSTVLWILLAVLVLALLWSAFRALKKSIPAAVQSTPMDTETPQPQVQQPQSETLPSTPAVSPQPTQLARRLRQALGITGQTIQQPVQDIRMTIQPKARDHVWAGMGDRNTISVNDGFSDIQSGTLTLRRGIPYRFLYNNADYPIYFTTSAKGNNNGTARIPGSPHPFTSDTVVVFDDSYPSELFYQSAKHQFTGGRIHLIR